MADIVVSTAGSTPPSSNMASISPQSRPNGHSGLEATESPANDGDQRTESDLSDVEDIPVPAAAAGTSPSASSSPNQEADFDDAETEQESSDQDAPGDSDDGDFDVADNSTRTLTNGTRMDRSTSTESRRPTKRKYNGVEDDPNIRENPELYGLRRSVCLDSHYTPITTDHDTGSPIQPSHYCKLTS